MRYSRRPPTGLCLLMSLTVANAAAQQPSALVVPALSNSKRGRGGPANVRGAAQAPYELHIDFTQEPPVEQVEWFSEEKGPLATGQELSAEQRRGLLEAFRQVEVPKLVPLSEALRSGPAQEEWQRKLWEDYRAWLGREPLVSAEAGALELTEEVRLQIALRVGLRHVLEGMGQEALRWIEPGQLAFMVAASVTAYFLLAALPEPLSKGVVLWVTLALVGAFGVDVVLHVLAEWRVLTVAAKQARTFAELEAAGTRFGLALGEDGTRMILTAAALWVGRFGLTKAPPTARAGPVPTAQDTARFAREAETLLRKLAPATPPGMLRTVGPRGATPVALEKVESLTLRGDRVVFSVRVSATTTSLYTARSSQAEKATREERPRSPGGSEEEQQPSQEEPPSPAPGRQKPAPATRQAPLLGTQAGAPPSPQDAQETPIDEALAERIRAALRACADKAYGDTLRKYWGGRRPTDTECDQRVTNAQGEQVSMAMWLGSLMHDEAQRCAEEILRQLKPGGFSTNPRYRRVPKDPANKNPNPKNPNDWRTEWIDPREESLLRGAEKLGTIVPDFVIHDRDPLRVQKVFDYKFPCKSGRTPSWRGYPLGHPYQRRMQDRVYKDFLKADPELISPNGVP
jgi:hypothetical protein